MKKTIYMVASILMVACSLQSEQKLEEKIKVLNKENEKLISIQAKLELKCNQANINLNYGIHKGTLNIDNLEEKKNVVCGDLNYVVNKILENNQKMVDLQLLLLEKES